MVGEGSHYHRIQCLTGLMNADFFFFLCSVSFNLLSICGRFLLHVKHFFVFPHSSPVRLDMLEREKTYRTLRK